MNKLARRTALRITVLGQVQGVGFRPWAYRTARSLVLTGSVANNPAGVEIIACGRRAYELVRKLRSAPPPLSRITGLSVERVRIPRPAEFRVLPSAASAARAVAVMPDVATCPDCLAEVADPADRRYRYAFTNCTQCGPRYAIVEALPYDRQNTTMRGFRLCPECRREYSDPADRRFHAQPVACPNCGPRLSAFDRSGRPLSGDPMGLTVTALLQGKAAAVKGLGGFHLGCDATSDRAVMAVRRCKGRDAKPLAIMCRNVSTIRELCVVGRDGLDLLRSTACPIVLLPKRRRPAIHLSGLVAPANSSLGVMLPYTPLHHLLLAELERRAGRPVPLVMTSANRSEQPIATTVPEALRALRDGVGLVLSHDRPIANRCDDSVAAPGPLVMVRRARGYVPAQLTLAPPFHVKHPVLAVGADLRNSFALASGDRLFPGVHVGSVEPGPGEAAFREALSRMLAWTGIRPEVVACDLHPDYWSTRLAEELSREMGVPLVRVQHHYAHTLAVMAEHGACAPAIGLSCDGTGYGTDGAVWGCEILAIDRGLSWERVGHLAYLRHGEGAGELANPARVAGAYLCQTGMAEEARMLGLPVFGPRAVRGFGVTTSSLGRLFDAVAAIIGACRRARFEGEAPVALEALVTGRLGLPRRPVLEPEPLLRAAAQAALAGAPPAVVARSFHAVVAAALANSAAAAARRLGTEVVCLSGGVMLNHTVRRALVRRLNDLGFCPLLGRELPANDGGVAAGQAIAASAASELGQRVCRGLTGR